jgi:hypothetical protein
MRRTIALAGFAAALGLAAASLIALPSGASRAADGKESTFLIPASDGYGVADCLSTGSSECGRVVADAWCEAQGFSRSESFGRAAADEVTGSIDTLTPRKESERPIRITCAD